MVNIIIAFKNSENARKIRNILIKYGIEVSAVYDTGSAVINMVNNQDRGIVILGYYLKDMHYSELLSYLPGNYKVILIGSPTHFESVSEEVNLISTPIKVHSFLEKVKCLSEELRTQGNFKGKKKTRSEADNRLIMKAKSIIMEKNALTEEEAHRYLQKMSMNSGSNVVETAEKILLLYDR